jgi:hypothetical protein
MTVILGWSAVFDAHAAMLATGQERVCVLEHTEHGGVRWAEQPASPRKARNENALENHEKVENVDAIAAWRCEPLD